MPAASIRKWLCLISCALALPCGAQDLKPNVAAGRVLGYYNGVLVVLEECSSRFPDRADYFYAAFEPWIKRNRPARDKAVAIVLDELIKMTTNEAERTQVMQIWEKAQATIQERAKQEVLGSLNASPKAFCENVTGAISSGQGELSVKFPLEIRVLGISP